MVPHGGVRWRMVVYGGISLTAFVVVGCVWMGTALVNFHLRRKRVQPLVNRQTSESLVFFGTFCYIVMLYFLRITSPMCTKYVCVSVSEWMLVFPCCCHCRYCCCLSLATHHHGTHWHFFYRNYSLEKSTQPTANVSISSSFIIIIIFFF